MAKSEATVVAAVQPVDHVLDALDVTFVWRAGSGGAARGLRLDTACRAGSKPGGEPGII